MEELRFKLSQYADDTTLILNGSEQYFKISQSLIEAFGKISGLRLNDRKTGALWIGSKTNSNKKFFAPKKLQMAKGKVKALGVWFATDQDIAIS